MDHRPRAPLPTASCRKIAATLLLTMAMTGLARSQAAEPPAAPPSKENPGLVDELGKLFSGASPILPDMKSSGQAIEDFNARAWDATRNAADTLSRLTKSPGVSGRVACPISANGAPDCKAAADKLCRSKGFEDGRSVDTDSAETCSAKALIPGRARQPGDCRTDNYVTRAICR